MIALIECELLRGDVMYAEKKAGDVIIARLKYKLPRRIRSLRLAVQSRGYKYTDPLIAVYIVAR